MNSFSHFPDFAIINLVPIFILKMIPRKEQEPRKKMNLRPDRWTGARVPLQCCWHRTACLCGYTYKVMGRRRPVDKHAVPVLGVTVIRHERGTGGDV